MSKKKTHEEYEDELFERQVDAFPLEPYKGANIHILHECSKGHKWNVTPNMLLSSNSICPTCSTTKLRKTHEEYLSDLLDREIYYLPLDKYETKNTRLRHQCPEGHIWLALPYNILNGTSCPECSRSKNLVGGYNKTRFANNKELANSPGILYCIVLVNTETQQRECVKIGITKGTSNKNVLIRARGFKGYEPRIQKEVRGTLAQVFELEQKLHEQWKNFRYLDSLKFSGHTELFQIDKLQDILKSIPNKV